MCFGNKKAKPQNGAKTEQVISIKTDDDGDSSPQQKQQGKILKLLLIGESGVGKTAIATRYVEQNFQTSIISTIGVDFKKKILERNGEKITLQIWDTAGQEKFRSMTASYYRGLQGVVVVFDVCSSDSFTNIKRWMEDIAKHAPATAVKVLAGNKMDLPHREVTTEEATQAAKEFNVSYLETSAKSNTNISELFDTVLDQILESQK